MEYQDASEAGIAGRSDHAPDARINVRLAARMKAVGIDSLADLRRRLAAEGYNSSPEDLSGLYRGKVFARRKNGTWSDAAAALSDLFGCLPEELFDHVHQWGDDAAEERMDEIRHAEILRLTNDVSGSDPASACEDKDLADAVASALGTLTPREERVLRLRYGIGAADEMTLESIGHAFGVTSSRIRDIELKALRKLKHPRCAQLLRAVFEGRLYEDQPPRRRSWLRPPPRPMHVVLQPGARPIEVSKADPDLLIAWPDLRSYGVELCLYKFDNGRSFLVVRNNPQVSSDRLAPGMRGLRHRADYLGDALLDLGFKRHSSGMWIEPSTVLSMDRFLAVLPKTSRGEAFPSNVTVRMASPVVSAYVPEGREIHLPRF